jgi:hypothetical protein
MSNDDDTRATPDFYTPEVHSPAYDEPARGARPRRPPEYEDDFACEHRPRPRKRGVLGRVLRGTALLVTGGVLVAAAVYLLPIVPADRLRALFAANSPAPKPAAAPITVPNNSLIGKQAEAWGIQTCLAAIVSTADGLTRNTDYNYRLMRGQQDPDQEMLSGVVAAREPKSGISGISSFYAQPTVAGRCDIASQTTIYFDEPCARVRQGRFPAFTTQLDFGQIAAAFTTADRRESLYLLPAGESGCLAVSTAATY